MTTLTRRRWRALAAAGALLAFPALANKDSNPDRNQAEPVRAHMMDQEWAPGSGNTVDVSSSARNWTPDTTRAIPERILQGRVVNVRSRIVNVDVGGPIVPLDARGLQFRHPIHAGQEVRAAFQIQDNRTNVATNIWAAPTQPAR